MKRILTYSTAILLLMPLTSKLHAQKGKDKKEISMADIWRDGTFSQEYVSGLRSMKDGLHYTILERKGDGIQLSKYSYENGKFVEALVEASDLKYKGNKLRMQAYEFSADESKVLIATEVESIYRRSSKAFYYILNLENKDLKPLNTEEKQMYADFSPAGSKVAYVLNNNLYYKDLETDKLIQVTDDGEKNKIINGASDWVYEEELELSQAFEWSPDGNFIAFYRFDESEVKMWNMKIYNDLYPEQDLFKYPKAGEKNSEVEIRIYDLKRDKHQAIGIDTEYEYITGISWNEGSGELAVISSNRHQNEVKVTLVDAKKLRSRLIHTEVSETYIEMPFDIHFLNDGKEFIVMSEKDGYRHFYRYNTNGRLKNQITEGTFPVTEYYGLDADEKWLYYQAADPSPLERHIYKVNIKSGKKVQLSKREGTNSASFSKSFDYYLNYHTTANQPYYISLNNNSGKEIRTLKDNKDLMEKLEDYAITEKQFFEFTTSEDIKLNAWMIKPPDFDESKQYPVFITIYGGPGYQTVTDAWGGSNYFWHQHLAQKGYIVVSVDMRGSGSRGVDFKKITYKQLGKYETIDLIETAKYMAGLDYVDGERIGVQGWSYGGYMSSLAILKGADQFKAAIAVAPVTNWRFYDSIYTERYMQTPQENGSGYDDNSPINHVEKLKGAYLLVHGTADDNVHFQNTTEMISALIKADKQFDHFIYPDKNHGIYGGNTRYHLYTMMTNFLLENL